MNDPLKVIVELVGKGVEFGGECVVIDGFLVPFITVHPAPEGEMQIVLDHRFGMNVSHDDFIPIICFIADAMSVAGGFSCFGKNGMVRNPFQEAYRAETIFSFSEKEG